MALKINLKRMTFTSFLKFFVQILDVVFHPKPLDSKGVKLIFCFSQYIGFFSCEILKIWALLLPIIILQRKDLTRIQEVEVGNNFKTKRLFSPTVGQIFPKDLNAIVP